MAASVFKGDFVSKTNPLAVRLLPKLAYQLAPAVVVTTVGVILLSSLAKAPPPAPEPAPIETAINGDAIFKAVPRELAEQDAKPAKASKPKALAVNTVAPQSRKPAPEIVAAPAQLPPVLGSEQPHVSPVAPSSNENTVMSKLLAFPTAVREMPGRAARSMSGWFTESEPPRPPAPVPTPHVQASM